MASLRKFPRSPYWFACFTAPDGKRAQRSTKETKRKPAQTIADEWEKLAKEKAKAKQAHRVVADIYRRAHGENLPSSTTELFLTGWLARRKNEVKPASYVAYNGRVKHFLGFLGASSQEPLGNLTKDRLTQYRNAVAERLSATTANQAIKTIRFMLEDARRDGFLAENPALDIKPLKDAGKTKARRPFTLPELRALLAVADDEWRSMIYFGLYTGQRLADIAQLRWSNLDLTANEIRLITGKTGRSIVVPLAKPLQDQIATLEAGDNAHAPLHPRALSHIREGGMASGLSRQFGELMEAAGLRKATSHAAKTDGKGRNAKRPTSEISFHALRHTATSLMKNAGISPAVVADIVGHDSAEMSNHYTHIENDAKRTALNSLPDLSKL
jgi:integrase